MLPQRFSRCPGERGVYIHDTFGVYLNLVEGLLWVQDVVRSNRTTPTIALYLYALTRAERTALRHL